MRLLLLIEIDTIVSKLEKLKTEGKVEHNLISKIAFSYLQKLCLVRLITFNTRRGGEASKIKLEQWLNCNKWKREKDIQNLEDPMRKLLAQRLNLVYSKGKRNKRVPTLFTDELSKALTYLVNIEITSVSWQKIYTYSHMQQETQKTMSETGKSYMRVGI